MLTKIIMMTICYHSLHSGSDPGEDHVNQDNHIHRTLHTGQDPKEDHDDSGDNDHNDEQDNHGHHGLPFDYYFQDGLHACYKPWDDHNGHIPHSLHPFYDPGEDNDDHDNHNDHMHHTLHLGYKPGDYHDDNDVQLRSGLVGLVIKEVSQVLVLYGTIRPKDRTFNPNQKPQLIHYKKAL